MKKFYIQENSLSKGPFDIEELQNHNINKDTMIWFENMEDWKKAGEINELKTILGATLPPIPAPKKSRFFNKKTLLFSLGSLIILLFIVIISNALQSNEDANNSIEEFERDQRNHILSNVIVTNNNYDTDIWGGISNLKITCQNNSTVSLDQITVNVKYIKRNGGTYKDEKILFNNVTPSLSQTIQAPNSERGLSVKVTLEKIYASEINLCYDSNTKQEIGNPDPFLCQ